MLVRAKAVEFPPSSAPVEVSAWAPRPSATGGSARGHFWGRRLRRHHGSRAQWHHWQEWTGRASRWRSATRSFRLQADG
jgi:hypothetical protein